jgi:hypothetical protein
MNAFIGRLMCSAFLPSLDGEVEDELGEVEEELVGDIWVIADMAVRLELMPERLCIWLADMWLGIWYMAACCMADMLDMCPPNMV